ncbi:MAG: antibiotic biosynthesis monooxygenase [Nocardioidaceae bacterium]
MMWIIAGHVLVDEDERDRFVDEHRILVERSRRAAGCLDVAITADTVDPRRINNFERWDSWDAIEAWRAQAEAPATGITLHEVDVTAYEVASSRPPFGARPQENRSIQVTRTVDAPPERVFALLADPDRHRDLDETGMIQHSHHPGALTELGEVFVMDMHSELMSDYRVDNHVVVYEPNAAIGWAPAAPGQRPAGHTFVYRLTPDGPQRTLVTQTYDWSAFTDEDAQPYLPVVNRDQLAASLDRLAAALT